MKKVISVFLTSFLLLSLGMNPSIAKAETTMLKNEFEERTEESSNIVPLITINYFIVNRDAYAGEQIWHEGWSAGKYYRGYLQYTGRTGFLGLTGKYRYEGELVEAPVAPMAFSE